MTCQRCQDQATVHLTETVNGRRREWHLCARCARKADVLPAEPKAATPGLDDAVQGLITANVGELVGELASLACPLCGLKFMEFRAGGRLGCVHDYQVFARGLLPILQRAHDATRHVGKVPRARPAAQAQAAERLRVRVQLRHAIAREDYEEAARLRDRLRLKDADV